MKAELVADSRCILGEGPLWHPDEKRLLWTDIRSGRLFRYDPESRTYETFYEGDLVAGFTLQQDGSLLLFGDLGSIRRWDKGQVTTLVNSLPGEEAFRFNDVIADPAGRVFCGTLSHTEDQPGRVYRLEQEGGVTQILDGVGCSNGMGYSRDRKRMYYTDSQAQAIYCFDYEESTGATTNQQVFARIMENDVFPDGLTVDAEGGVWSALWGGYAVVRFTSEGREDRRIEVPARNVTSLTFGGSDLTDMYITTAGGNQEELGPSAGGLYRVRPGVSGMPEFRSRIAP